MPSSLTSYEPQSKLLKWRLYRRVSRGILGVKTIAHILKNRYGFGSSKISFRQLDFTREGEDLQTLDLIPYISFYTGGDSRAWKEGSIQQSQYELCLNSLKEGNSYRGCMEGDARSLDNGSYNLLEHSLDPIHAFPTDQQVRFCG